MKRPTIRRISRSGGNPPTLATRIRKQITFFCFNSLSKGLARIPSFVYALAYISLIPIFAVVYSNLPHQFYHSTIVYEKPTNDAKIALERMFNKEINSKVLYKDGKPDIEFKDAFDYSIEDIQSNGEGLNLHMRGDFFNATGERPTDGEEKLPPVCQGDLLLKFEGTTLHEADSESDSPYYNAWITPDDDLKGKKYLRRIFAYTKQKIYPIEGDPDIEITITPKLHQALIDYKNSISGFPFGGKDNFARMLYFSAMTITTVGYGDIVPITPLTRSLVAIQAITGIVLIGLFLNSLAYAAGKEKK